MNDDFLKLLRKEPSPEFQARLRERLPRQEERDPIVPTRRGWRLNPLLAASMAAVALLAACVSSPEVRDTAEEFLDLFRVRNFAVVSVDPARIESMKKLEDGSLDLEKLFSDQVEILEQCGEPQVFPDANAAGQAAGFQPRVPATLPDGIQADSVMVQGSAAARLTVQTTKVREVLNALGLTDVTIPAALDGAQLEVRTSPAVVMQFRRGDRRKVGFIQARSPEVSLPPGVNLAEVGEIGLRIVGLDREEAHRFAQTIDWHSTVLIPLPTDSGTYRQVDVHGNKGLLIETQRTLDNGQRTEHAALMWAEGEMVYALAGNLSSQDLVLMANTVQ